MERVINNKVKFFHIQTTISGQECRATFATEILDTGEVLIGAAFCAPTDVKKYCKKTGRDIAFGRVQMQKNTIPIGLDMFTGHSADSIVRKWNYTPKPLIWTNVIPVNPVNGRLTFVEMVR